MTELVDRLLAAGIDDGGWIERFCKRHDVEESLRKASIRSPADYEEELGFLVETAKSDYEYYELDRPAEVQEGKVRPKKRLRVRELKDIAGVWERQKSLAHYLQQVASGDKKIVRFRERALSGGLLSEEEALAFFSSPLLADQPLHVLANRGISLLEKCRLLEEETDARGTYRRLKIKGWKPWRVRPLAAKGPELVYPGDVLRLQDARGLRGVGAIFFPHPRDEDRLVIARKSSVIAELFRLAGNSLVGYPISPQMGMWFILTGEFVPQYPVRMRYLRYRHPEFSRTTITLEVESWLPPEEILEQYRHAQHEILGGTPRSLKRKTVALFEFVNRHKGASWGKLFGAWNKAHPGQRFRDRSHLFTTYMRALEYIAGIKPTGDESGMRLKVAGTDSHGMPIYADKWYLLHPRREGEGHSYTGTFESREEAQGDPRSENSEVLTAKQLVDRLAERKNS
jgi:hypothetical protein